MLADAWIWLGKVSIAENAEEVVFAGPNVRAKRATTAGRQGPVGENVPRTADRALVACRWRSA